MADLALNPLAQVSPPLIEGAPTRAEITNTVAGVAENKTPRNWYIAISISGAMTLMLVAMLSYEVSTGVGVWGNNSPVYWGWPITNFVFWVGIGHAGARRIIAPWSSSSLPVGPTRRSKRSAAPRRRSHSRAFHAEPPFPGKSKIGVPERT